MIEFQSEKQLVLDYFEALANGTTESVEQVLSEFTSPDWIWRGFHPCNEQTGAREVAQAFWHPFLTAFSSVQRRQDIFFAGRNQIDGFQSTWVSSMGHLMGLFDAPLFGIPATGKIAMLRYAEFNRIEDGKIVETAFFFDLVHLMRQAGLNPFPEQRGAHVIQPGPLTHDGLLFEDQPANEGEVTLELINRMIGDIAANSNTGPDSQPADATPQDELKRCWHEDMLWWGPEGIGATYTIDRYIEQHQRPFRTQLTNRKFNGHICKMAEGNYGGFFGWPNLTLTSLGGYLGLPSGTIGDMRVIDMYRRDGAKLAENWIFIDIMHFLRQQGIDLLEQIDSMET